MRVADTGEIKLLDVGLAKLQVGASARRAPEGAAPGLAALPPRPRPDDLAPHVGLLAAKESARGLLVRREC